MADRYWVGGTGNWDASTTTVAGKWTYVGCHYNLAATAWHVVAVTTQA